MIKRMEVCEKKLEKKNLGTDDKLGFLTTRVLESGTVRREV